MANSTRKNSSTLLNKIMQPYQVQMQRAATANDYQDSVAAAKTIYQKSYNGMSYFDSIYLIVVTMSTVKHTHY